MENLTRAERTARIAQLEQELAALRAQQAADLTVDEQAVVAECHALKLRNKKVDAVKLYRTKLGGGLREALDAVNAM